MATLSASPAQLRPQQQRARVAAPAAAAPPRRSCRAAASLQQPASQQQALQQQQQAASLSRRSLLALPAAAAAVAALAGAAPAQAFVQPPPGYRYHQDKLDGYSFFFPEDWQPVTVRAEQLPSMCCKRAPHRLFPHVQLVACCLPDRSPQLPELLHP